MEHGFVFVFVLRCVIFSLIMLEGVVYAENRILEVLEIGLRGLVIVSWDKSFKYVEGIRV